MIIQIELLEFLLNPQLTLKMDSFIVIPYFDMELNQLPLEFKHYLRTVQVYFLSLQTTHGQMAQQIHDYFHIYHLLFIL